MSTRRNRLTDPELQRRQDEIFNRRMQASAELRMDALVDVLTDVAEMVAHWSQEPRSPGDGYDHTGEDPEAPASADGDTCPNCGHPLEGNDSR